MFLHPLPVQRQHRDALRVSRQRAAHIPETIQPLQQLEDLDTQDRWRAISEESIAMSRQPNKIKLWMQSETLIKPVSSDLKHDVV